MHIAICEDNVADRKQSERLMDRESDKWIAAGKPIYTYTYGSIGSLIAGGVECDGVLIEIKETGGLNTRTAIADLRDRGLSSVFIVCMEEEKYIKDDYPEDTLYLRKPIRPEELHSILERVEALRSENKPKIELRGEGETLYIEEDEFLYARQEGTFTVVTLTDGRTVRSHGQIVSLYESIEDRYPKLFPANNKTIVNAAHITGSTFFKVYMTDGESFSLDGYARKYLKTLKI